MTLQSESEVSFMSEDKKSGLGGVLAAGVVGLAAGAAAVFFSDKKNRDKAKGLAENVKKAGSEQLAKAKSELKKRKRQGAKKLVKKLDKVWERLEKEAGTKKK